MASDNQQPKLRPGVDTPLFYLDAERKWRLASDGLQWIIQKRGPMQHEGRYAGQRRWKSLKFWPSRDGMLRRMKDMGIELTDEALGRIAHFPPTIRNWEWDGRQFEGDDADVEREPPQRLTEALDRNVDHAAAAE